MIAAQALQATQYRLASHYLTKLRAANQTYQRGGHHALEAHSALNADWAQVRQWQTWSMEWVNGDEVRARLCLDFALFYFGIFRLRLSADSLLDWLQQALSAARELQEEAHEREVLSYIILTCLDIEQFDAATDYARVLLEKACAADDALGQARALNYQAGIHIVRYGQYDVAESQLEAGKRLLTGLDAPLDLSRVLLNLSRIAVFRGNYKAARDLNLQSIALYEETRNVVGIGSGLIAACGVSLFLGDVAAAGEYARRSLEIARAFGTLPMLAPALIMMGHVEKAMGHYGMARQYYAEGIKTVRVMGSSSTLVNGLYGWAQSAILDGQIESGLTLYDEALQIAMEAKSPFRIGEVTADLVLVLSERGEIASAKRYLVECIAQAHILKTARYELMAIGAAVVFALADGRQEQAAVWAGAAHERGEYIEKLGIFERACGQLERELGAARYAALCGQGKAMTLAAVIEEVAGMMTEEQRHDG
jgi:hypothetical protein